MQSFADGPPSLPIPPALQDFTCPNRGINQSIRTKLHRPAERHETRSCARLSIQPGRRQTPPRWCLRSLI